MRNRRTLRGCRMAGTDPTGLQTSRPIVPGIVGRRFGVNKLLEVGSGFDRLAIMLPGVNEAEWNTRKTRIDAKLRALNPP